MYCIEIPIDLYSCFWFGCRTTFSTDDSPLERPQQKPATSESSATSQHAKDTKPNATESQNLFQTQSIVGFDEFLATLRSYGQFDITLIAKHWCQHFSQYWSLAVPAKLQTIYITLYRYHLRHFDAAQWPHADTDDFRDTFRATVWYLELQHDRAVQQQRHDAVGSSSGNDSSAAASTVDAHWLHVFQQLLFHTAYFERATAADETSFAQYRLRWTWLQYLQARFESKLEVAVDFLYASAELCSGADGELDIMLPSQRHNEHICHTTIDALRGRLERNIRLNSVPQLYRNGQFASIVPILSDSLRACDWRLDPLAGGPPEDGAQLLPTTQLEILLEAFYQLDCFDECMQWTEHALGYAWMHFSRAPAETARHATWAALVSFAMRYAHSLITEESARIVERLGDAWAARFVQTCGRIVADQLDGTVDRNQTHVVPHAVCTRLPWLLLHAIIQREEDVQYARQRRAGGGGAGVDQQAATELATAPMLADENGVPMSVMVFFTAHEFLGARSWCTRENGAFLLHIMDTVADVLRTPALDKHRDVVAEYLEQVTYCLYGYPARKARARHIEEHDACNVELTWPRAVQLFDLYRPEALPEFNSYK